MQQPWKEVFVDRMGLIVALSGQRRMEAMSALVSDIRALPAGKAVEVKECLRLRFTPTNGGNGCQSATEAVKAVTIL